MRPKGASSWKTRPKFCSRIWRRLKIVYTVSSKTIEISKLLRTKKLSLWGSSLKLRSSSRSASFRVWTAKTIRPSRFWKTRWPTSSGRSKRRANAKSPISTTLINRKTTRLLNSSKELTRSKRTSLRKASKIWRLRKKLIRWRSRSKIKGRRIWSRKPTRSSWSKIWRSHTRSKSKV